MVEVVDVRERLLCSMLFCWQLGSESCFFIACRMGVSGMRKKS